MNPITKIRLEKTCEYHDGVSKYYKTLAGLRENDKIPEEDETDEGEFSERATVEGDNEASEEDANKEKQRKEDLKLARTHADVVRQLRAVLDRQPVETAVLTAQRAQEILRDPAFGLKPSAGRFH